MVQQQNAKKNKRNKKKDRTIIVVPLSLIDQWIGELNKICDSKSFKIINYYGSGRSRLKQLDFEKADIVLSTTQTFSNIIGKMTKEWDDFESKFWMKSNKQQLLFKLESNFFTRMIIDESHEIKNTATKRSEIICAFAQRCKYRWCLTGTPINNDLPVDLGGMCRFLGMKHEKYVKLLKLNDNEKEEAKIENKRFNKNKTLWLDFGNDFCMNKIKKFLKELMIRRTKDNVLKNDFPEKREEIIMIEMNNEEKVIYHKIAKGAKDQYKQFKERKSVMAHYMHLMRMLMKLRKLCDHPSMVFNKIDVAATMNSDNIMSYGSNIDVLQKLHDDIVRRINEMESILEGECPICFEPTELNGGILSKCGHLFCTECLQEQLEANNAECGLCRNRFTKSNIIRVEYLYNSTKLQQKHKDEYQEFKLNGGNNNKNDDEDNDDEKDEEEENNNVDCDKYDEFVKKYKEISCCTSKMEALIDRLKYIQDNHNGDKSIVFSNFSNFFGIISKKLDDEGIKHLQFHAGLNRKKRKKVLDEFEESSDCRVLLISAKCASVGLNLMCANHVIFLDPRINPGLDEQAICRCWRIGQKKVVYVTRLIIKDTVEEKLLSLMKDKENDNDESNANQNENKNTKLKRKAKLLEADYDMIFGYVAPPQPENEENEENEEEQEEDDDDSNDENDEEND